MLEIQRLKSTLCGGLPLVLVGILAGVLAGGLAGCGGNKVTGNRHHDKTTEIQIGDFRADPNAPVIPVEPVGGAQPDAAMESSDQPGEDLVMTHRNEPVDDAPRNVIRSGEGGLEFLDAKVGDISGHPIYVSSFFEPIADRLIASGKQNNLQDWRAEAINIVQDRLKGIIYDELLRAETIAALTPQQRVGLQSFLKDFRSNLLSENLGSKELANRRILEEQGITLDEALRQKELDTLVGLTLYQEINRGINISWRDIKQRYERDIDRFQPPPTVVLQVISVLEPEGELVDSITARLNSGESFAEIASSDINTFNNDTQGLLETVLEEDFETTKFFAPEPLNEAVWGLDEGEWAGPVSLGNANFWILYVERRQESKSLYEAQLQISRELMQERRAIGRAEFLTNLMERARVSSQNEIMLRLLYIAEQQYGPKG